MSQLGNELRAEVQKIIDEPMPEPSPSEPPEIETEGVFEPEFDLSGIFSGLPSMLSATLGNALTNMIERMTTKPEREFKVYDFGFSDHKQVGPHNVDAFVDAFMEARQKRIQIIEEFLNDGWEICEQIVCSPNVMLIFSREKETNNEREQ